MYARMRLMTLALCFIVCSLIWANGEAPKNDGGLSIVITSLKTNDKILQMDYEVVNNSQSEIWICDSISQSCDFEIFMEEENQTIIVRRRLDVPSALDWFIQPHGRYICVHSGEKRRESLLLSLPIWSRRRYSDELHEMDIQFASLLAIELG
jgi:hypothetical protein